MATILLSIFWWVLGFWLVCMVALLSQIISEYKEYKKHKED